MGFGRTRTLLTVLVALSSSACLEKCAPGLVGPAVARLTGRNLGAVIQLVNEDTICGFESDRVRLDFTVDAQEGQQGCVTWTVRDCDLDYTTSEHISYDCSGIATATRGRVVVDASRTVCGTITGDPNQPVVPVSPDAVTIALERVFFDDFEVVGSTIDAKLTWKSGSVSAVAKPRLAVSTQEGLCTIATPNIELSEIRYEDALVNVVGEGRTFDVPVGSSAFTLINGVHGDRENALFGEIEVYGSKTDVDDGDGLDPDYNTNRFVEGFACTEGIATPVSYECKNVAPVLAQGAARLTIRSLAAVASITETDDNCGFSSASVLEAFEILEGEIGHEGTVRFSVEGCSIAIEKPRVTSTSCTGEETQAQGRIIVSGEKIMHGRLTGNLLQPVVPMNDHPVEIYLSHVELDGFEVAGGGQSLTQVRGAVAGRLVPRVAMDTGLGACAFQTPIARITDVEYKVPTEIVIDSTQGRFETKVDVLTLTAVNGNWDGDENVLDGNVTMLGETFQLPTNPLDDGLDPAYDPNAFETAWMCGSVDTEHPFECRFVTPLAQGASQLTVMALGRIASLLDADTTCGFASDPVLDAAVMTGTLGDPGGSAQFAVVTPCSLEFETPTVIDEDCHGNKTVAHGTVRVTGTKRLEGYVSGDRLQPIVPTSWEPAQLAVAIEADGFEIWVDPGTGDGGRTGLALRTGSLTGRVRPRTAIDKANGACAKPTPVALFEDVVLSDADARMTSEDRAFDVQISNATLEAVSGARAGRENVILGSIVLDGETFGIPTAADLGLDPNYDPVAFIDGFTCDPDLELPADEAACNMKKPLGEGAARLVLAALGAATHLVNLDDSCGYDDIFVLADPSRVEGEPGEIGLMEWELEECEPGYGRPYNIDCLGRESFASGSVLHTGRRTVRGIREDLIVADSIIPNTHNSVTVVHDELKFTEFGVRDVEPGETLPARAVTIHEGTLSAVVEPITGRNPDGGYDVRTSVARISDVIAGPLPMTIFYLGKTFNVDVEAVNIRAVNGSYEGWNETNLIEGEIIVDGQMITMAPQALEPEYDQSTFDARYECIEGLQETVPPSDVPPP